MSRRDLQLREYNTLIEQLVLKLKKGEGELRFNRPFLIASDVAAQYFCEKKVEMQYLHGEIETEQKTLGTEAHEKLLEGSVETRREALWKEIYGKKPVFVLEMPIVAKYKDLILAGRPDVAIFLQGFPMFIFEYKFSNSRRPFRDHHVQVRTYGLILRNMGFDTSQLFYAIIMAEPKAKDDKELTERVIEAVVENGPKEAVLAIESATVYVNKFDSTQAERDLDWAVDFWMKKREAIPTENPNKCKSCEYSSECMNLLYQQGGLGASQVFDRRPLKYNFLTSKYY